MAAKNRSTGLGRGLDALFADRMVSVSETEDDDNLDDMQDNKILYIGIHDIKANKNQPRKHFDENKIVELANSILEHGIIQPLVVRKKDNYYELVAGERRLRAAKKAGIKTVPCILKELSDADNMLIAIIENMQREDLNPIEEALGLNEMIKTYDMTQEEVSKSVSKSRPYITNALRLLKLPNEIQELVANGTLSTGHARALLSITNRKQQEQVCQKIIKDNLSVRETEKLVSQKKVENTNNRSRKKDKDDDIIYIENQLKTMYGTKVNISERGKKGKIEIEFYSREELQRLIDILSTIK